MKKAIRILGVLLPLFLLCGCSFVNKEQVRLRDLDFTVLGEEKIPDELKVIIEERKEEAFKLTYRDGDFLYIVIGYGKQDTGGYSIAVSELYLTENAVCVSTNLLGPREPETGKGEPSYPYIVIKTEKREETVIFE